MFRESVGLNQGELAKALGIGRFIVNRVETGHAGLRLEVAESSELVADQDRQCLIPSKRSSRQNELEDSWTSEPQARDTVGQCS